MPKSLKYGQQLCLVAVVALSLAACGGGGGGGGSDQGLDTNLQSSAGTTTQLSSDEISSSVATSTAPEPKPAQLPPSKLNVFMPAPGGVTCATDALTCVEVISTGTSTQGLVPVTFGQPFKPLDYFTDWNLIAKDNLGNSLPLQIDAISRRADDKSVRFGVISTQLTNLAASERRVINLYVKKDTAFVAPMTTNGVNGYDLKIQAKIFRPQLTKVSFGNRSACTATPAQPQFIKGEVITLKVNGTSYSVQVTDAMAVCNFSGFTEIAKAFAKQITSQAGSPFLGIRPNYGGVYEDVYVTTVNPDAGAFTVSWTYSGSGRIVQSQVIASAPATTWSVDGAKALKNATVNLWLKGPSATEYITSERFADASGKVHPQLTARLNVRSVDQGRRFRTDMVIENNWAYEENPGNLVYDLKVSRTVNGTEELLYERSAIRHLHHARWHRVFWQGVEPQTIVRHQMTYFVRSGVVWNYDTSLVIPESVLNDEITRLSKADIDLMGNAFITRYFPQTGGRQEIGPYPRWVALFLVSQDERARKSMMVNADAAGSVPIHFRDRISDQDQHPISIAKRPGVALAFGEPAPADALPVMVDSLADWSPDTAHQGSFAFVPYLITGDAYYLDEIMFWASWNVAALNRGYREGASGLLWPSNQIRSIAWSLRSLGEAARALPDTHPARSFYDQVLTNNLNWVQERIVKEAEANSGKVSPLGALGRINEPHLVDPWQNDFVSLVLAQLVEDGYSAQAGSYFKHLAKFTVGRFNAQAEGFCTAKAPFTTYFKLKDSSSNFISTWGGLYRNQTHTAWSELACVPDMTVEGYPESAAGGAAYARAMLAASYNAAKDNSFKAEALKAYLNLSQLVPKMNGTYLQDPTWAILPKQ